MECADMGLTLVVKSKEKISFTRLPRKKATPQNQKIFKSQKKEKRKGFAEKESCFRRHTRSMDYE